MNSMWSPARRLTWIIPAIFFMLQNVNAQRPDFLWAKGLLGAEQVTPTAVATDALGNVVIGGVYSGTVDFNPGSGVTNMTANGYDDIFFLKLNGSGEFLWAFSLGGESSEYLEGMALDPQGNIYVTGHYSGEVDFDPEQGVHKLAENGGADIFIAKYNSSGAYQWAHSFGNEYSDAGTHIHIDKAGNVLVVGEFQDPTDFDPGAGVAILDPFGMDTFIAKYTPAGALVWARMIGGTGNVNGYHVTSDARNNVYVTGRVRNKVDFDPGPGTHEITTTNNEAFLLKLNADGLFKYVVLPGGSVTSKNFNNHRPVGADKDGSVYLAYDFKSSADFNPGTGTVTLTSNGFEDIFLQKLDSLGNFIWVKQVGGSSTDLVNDLIVSESGDLFVTGRFNGTVDFDPGPGVVNLNANGDWNTGIYIARYNKNGELVWAYDVKRNDDTWPYGDGNALCLDKDGNLLAIGEFSGTYNFNPGNTSVLLSSVTENVLNGFVMKLKGTLSGMSITESGSGVILFPNPFNDQLEIRSVESLKDARLTIRNLSGQIIYIKSSMYGNNFVADLPVIPAGIYLFEVVNGSQRSTGKIVKN